MLAVTLAPVTGTDGEVMRDAARHAEERVQRLIRHVTPASARRLIGSTGVAAVINAVESYRRGDQIPAGPEAAWLTVVLKDLRVRDDGWCRMEPEHREQHLKLWTDLTRLARPGYAASGLRRLAVRQRGAGQRRAGPGPGRQPAVLDGPADPPGH
jgi:hypothetical protein